MRAEPRFKPLPPEPATLLTEGRFDEAVQALRNSHGLGAREARAWIESHIANDPMLRVQLETQRRARRGRIFFWALVIDTVIIAALVYYFTYMPH